MISIGANDICYAFDIDLLCFCFALHLRCVHFVFIMCALSILYASKIYCLCFTMYLPSTYDAFAMYNICLLNVQCPFPDALVECTSMHYNYKSIAVFNDYFGCALLMLMDTHDILLNVWVQYLFRNSCVHVKD